MTETELNDVAYKDSIRREWTAAATGWRRWFDTTEAESAGRALTRVLLQQADLRAGDAVLDVGSGYGEPGLSAAADVGPDGHVTCLDISGDMLAFAEERARSAGLTNTRFVEADIETVDLEPASFDVVLSRNALMYASDPLTTISRLRTLLRPGGRLAAAVWATPDKVAFATPVGIITETLDISLPTDGPGPFALGAPGVLEDLLRHAGLADITSGTAIVVYETPDAESCTQWLRDVAPPITELVADQPPAVQDEIWQRVTEAWMPFQDDSGTVRLPSTAIWVAGTSADEG